ncbi:MAG TPA: gliding motility-associated ABC transporter substrate-binding protein GldG [Cyclobacteriaceae bacterium]|nr:gliding motility-associated ABC transporter substrate-binding protein GldG [Cyclobacteriaceae bacterium]
MVNWESRKTGDLLQLANALALVVLINLVAAGSFFRIDLTEEKRFTVKPATRDMLASLDDEVYVEVYLEGDLNAGFRRFQKSIRETLEEFRIYSNNKVNYTFVDPTTAMSQQAQNEFIRALAEKGITATNVVERVDGETSAKLIFPGALVSYGGFETGAMLLKGNDAQSPEEEINQSIEGVEFELANAIYKLFNTDRKRVGLLTGHGELDSLDIAAFNNALLEQYDVRKVDLSRRSDLDPYNAIIIIKPRTAFSEADKFKLDQFVMRGGKLIFLLDRSNASMDNVSDENTLALPLDLNLDDLLFRYGVRINHDLVQDRNSSLYPIVTGESGGKPRMQMLEWPFFPLINHYADHPVTRNLNATLTRFVSSIDTVKAEGVRKIPLLMTSQYSRVVGTPSNISVQELLTKVTPEEFNAGSRTVGYLLEGRFTSLFRNRFAPEGMAPDTVGEFSKNTGVVVISDGDIARNEINTRTGQAQPLGFDPFSNYTFANQDLLMNIMAYLTDEDGLITVRSKEVKIRPLDRERISSEKVKWQVINLALPLVAVVLLGIFRAWYRKRKFARV